jgi:hypothetical protein
VVQKERAVVDVVERGCACVDLDSWMPHRCVLDRYPFENR